jgi:hypothetical protein
MAEQGSQDALGIIITPTNASNTTFSYQVDTVQTGFGYRAFITIRYPGPRYRPIRTLSRTRIIIDSPGNRGGENQVSVLILNF